MTMTKTQRGVHSLMTAVAVSNAVLPTILVSPAHAQQAVNVVNQPILGTSASPIGTASVIPASLGTWALFGYLPTTGAAAPANSFLGGCIAGTSVTSSAGSAIALQCNATGNLDVFVINASPNGAHNTANSPTINIATDQTAADPCMFQMKSFTSFAFTTLGTTQIIAGISGQKIYGCSLSIIVGTATNFSLTEGSNATCSTTAAGVFGNPGTAPANGFPFAANGGETFGNGGGLIFKTANATNGICVLNSATSLVVGTLGYVSQ